MTIYCFRCKGGLGFYDPNTKRAIFDHSKIKGINEPELCAVVAPELGDHPKGIEKDFEMTITNSLENKAEEHYVPWYKFKESQMLMKQFDDLYEATIYANSCRESYFSSLRELEEMVGVLFRPNLESPL